MNYNDKNYRPPITYSQLNTKSFCKRKQIMCEYANVLGYCIQTWCAKGVHSKTDYITRTMLGGDTE